MKKMTPKVSIIIPLFNAEKYVRICVESVLQQTFTDFELIVIDDCSTDRSAEIVQTYDDPRLKFYKRAKNSGRSDTRNFGLELSVGEYIFFMDDDDAILPNAIEILVTAADESQAEAIYMNSFVKTTSKNFSTTSEFFGTRMFAANPKPRWLSTNIVDKLNSEYIQGGSMVNTWSRICRRDFLINNEIFFPLIPRNEDGAVHLAILCFAQKILVLDVCCYVHRSHSGNATNSSADEHMKLTLESLNLFVKYLKQVLARTNLSKENCAQIVAFSLKEMIRWLIVKRAYSGELDFDSIDRILTESLAIDSETYRAIFHAFALTIKWIYQINKNNRAIFELKGESF